MALGALFLFGCQEQGPTQATLDDLPPDFTPGFAKGGKGGNGCGGGGELNVELTGAAWTPAPQAVSVRSDCQNELRLGSDSYSMEWNFVDPDNIQNCYLINENWRQYLDDDVALIALFKANLDQSFMSPPATDFTFGMEPSSPEDGAFLVIGDSYEPRLLLDKSGNLITDPLRSVVRLRGPVDVSGGPSTARVFRLQEGRVEVGGRLAKGDYKKNLIGLTCDVIDVAGDVTVTVTSTP
jgi:hypothetical protein